MLVSSYLHRGGLEPLLGETIDQRFRAVVGRFPERDAVVSLPQSVRLSYAALDARCERWARALLALGLEAGDRVGVWSTNNLEWVLLQLATARVGVILVTINPANRSHELEYTLRRARIQALFLIPAFKSSDYVAMLAETCPGLRVAGNTPAEGLPELRHAILWDPGNPGSTSRPLAGLWTLSEFLAQAETVSGTAVRERAAGLDCDDPINIQFTSGTTGFPKPVVLTHHNILNNAHFVALAMRFSERDRLCVPVPFYHCFGMVLSNLACFCRGAALVIPAPHFEARATLEAVARERCTALHGVPTMFVAELELLREASWDLSSLRTGIMAGAPCPPALLRRVMEDLGCREILIAYGQTEASPVTHITRHDDSNERRVATVGTNMPHQEVKVVCPETGAVTPIGHQGEVCFRGYHVMRGYFEDEQATRSAIDDGGWLHSGDLGVMDASGYLRITGRLRDMIIRGGENIYPAEIEAFYYEHPQVAEVAVFGVADPRMGEEVAAWVQLHEGQTVSSAELREHARGKIAHFKVPRYVWVVESFPLTVTGKIQKFRMREVAERRLREEG